MPGRSFEIVYPNGDYEIDASRQHDPPAVGDTIRRHGKLWRVTATTAGKPVIVRVELVEERARDVTG
jgi:acyl dehydratase